MQIAIQGNTFPVKDALKALGAKWNAGVKAWTITSAKLAEANRIVANAPPPAAAVPGVCVQCKGAVKPPYTVCYACKNKGKCLNCGVPLSDYARRKGYKRCLDCSDGGGMAHGGRSYHDRHGNFVLGDDD